MRVFDRTDRSLAVALLLAGAILGVQTRHPFPDLNALHPQAALLSGLLLLSTSLGVHQYKRRRQAGADAAAARAEAQYQRARAAELEHLVAFGRALGSALEPSALRQVFWRYMPTFAGHRQVWMLTREHNAWSALVQDASAASERSPLHLEALAEAALSAMPGGTERVDGVVVEDDFCLPMIVGSLTVGVIGIRQTPAVTKAEQHKLCAAAALMAIAIRNTQLLAETRSSTIRDPLTGCFNGAYGREALAGELRRARRTSRPVAVIMFDVDDLTMINARYGYLVGDTVLKAIGELLSTTLRGTDVRCRFTADDFLLILPDTAMPGAQHVVDELTAGVATLRIRAGSETLTPSISVGLLVSARGELGPEAVLDEVGAALLRTRRSGRNRYALSPAAIAV